MMLSQQKTWPIPQGTWGLNNLAELFQIEGRGLLLLSHWMWPCFQGGVLTLGGVFPFCLGKP